MADLSQPKIFVGRRRSTCRGFLVAEVEDPFYRTLFQNIKDLINPPKLPPLEITSKPVAVKDIWGLYGRQKKSFMMSTGFQVAVVTVLFTVFSIKPVQTAMKQAVTIFAARSGAARSAAQEADHAGRRRRRRPVAACRPPRASCRSRRCGSSRPRLQVANNLNPKLTMEPTIIAPPDLTLPNVNMPNYGDPLAKIGPLSNGPGSGGGIGSGSGGGVGSGKGGGFGPGEGGGFGGGVFRVGGGVSAPVLLYKKEPEYSEEARKAKYQGTVVLYVEDRSQRQSDQHARGAQPRPGPG